MKQPIGKLLRKNLPALVLALALLTMLASSLVGHMLATAHGAVHMEEIYFQTDTGAQSHAKLYIPQSASPENPLPAVLLCHGYTASLDAMEPNAIELSRRGYVVMCLDMYGHGESTLPDPAASQVEMGGIPGYAPDLGSFSALQTLGALPYTDQSRIAMLGHSMGTAAIQEGAYLAFAKWMQDQTVIVPRALVLTGYNYNIRNQNDLTYSGVTAENGVFPLAAAPVNIATIYGQYDEFAELLWGVENAKNYTQSFKFALGTGASNVPMDTFFTYGDASAQALTREQAVTVAQTGQLRAAFAYPHTHSFAYYDAEPIAQGINFLDITLRDGNASIAPEEQVWQGRAACGAIGLAAAFIAFAAMALTLLKLPFFAALCRPEPKGLTTIHTPAQGVRYAVIYILCLLPAPLLYNFLVGYPYYMSPQGFIFQTLFMPNKTFNMSPVNGLLLLNVILGVFLLIVYMAVFYRQRRTEGHTLQDTGVLLPVKQLGKAVLLAIVSFVLVYLWICLCYAVSGVYFSWFKFNIMPMNLARWRSFFAYLPFWLFFGLVSALVFNTFTRIKNAREGVNILLVAFASVGGLMVFHAIDMGTLFRTGVRAFPHVPGTEALAAAVGFPFPTALAGIALFGLLVILPVCAVMNRVLFRKTGSIWVGGILTALIMLIFTVSHMVISV